MLLQELREIRSRRRERHQFGVLIGTVALFLGGLLLWRKGIYPGYFIVAMFCLLPVLVDKLFDTDTAIILLPFQKLWMGIAVIMGALMSRVVLGLCFFGAFTAVRVLNNCFAKPLLDTQWSPKATDSYWIRRKSGEYTPERTEKQF